jgi:FtsZ-interacting cell division protein ZipA
LPEFRWILLGLGIVLLVGIWWWGARRSRQAPGDAQMRESTASTILQSLHPVTAHADREAAESDEWGVPPFEPLSIRTAEFDDVPHIDLSMTAHSEPFDDTLDLSDVKSLPGAQPRPPPAASPLPNPAAAVGRAPAPTAAIGKAPARMAAAGTASAPPGSDRFNAVEPEEPSAGERQRIVSIRVCAPGDRMWPGADVLAVLEDLGLAHGRYQVFHRRHSDGRTLFCAASLVEPGTFNPVTMPEEQFRGLTLFAVLPGPAEPLQTIDALISTALDLAQALEGTVQLSKGVPLSPENAATLREDVARFQASMIG